MHESMTHYMELLATNQPWNLIIFMAIPVILAEYIAVTELYILTGRDTGGALQRSNRVAGITVGFYFLGIMLYLLFTAVVPLTLQGAWRGPADVIAVGFYLLGGLPLLSMAALELGVLGKQRNADDKRKLHATLIAVFLVVAHIAMIFGMLDPNLL
jgi:hypothetical protein